jgi:hypothetical protein
MGKAYNSILQGLTEALGHTRGRDVGARVRQIEVPAARVAVPGGSKNKLDPGSSPGVTGIFGAGIGFRERTL